MTSHRRCAPAILVATSALTSCVGEAPPPQVRLDDPPAQQAGPLDAGAGPETGPNDDTSSPPADAGEAPSPSDAGSGEGSDAGSDGSGGGDAGADAPVDEDAPPGSPLRVAVISDLNGSYGSTTYGNDVHAAVASLVSDPPHLVLITGDMVAGQQAGLDYAAMWEGFHDAVTLPLATAGIPVAATPGNHDASGYASFSAERDEYERQWGDHIPAVDFVDNADFPFRYAFRAGAGLFVSLDDTTVGPLAAEQRAWLDYVLDAPAAVKVVFGHVPIHPFTVGRETEVLGDDALEALLVEHDVDVFISGHHHGYYPGRRGPLRVVSMACLGSGPRALIGTSSSSPRGVVRFEVTEVGIVGLEGYTGSAFTDVIPRSTLPASIGSGDTRVDRDDL